MYLHSKQNLVGIFPANITGWVTSKQTDVDGYLSRKQNWIGSSKQNWIGTFPANRTGKVPSQKTLPDWYLLSKQNWIDTFPANRIGWLPVKNRKGQTMPKVKKVENLSKKNFYGKVQSTDILWDLIWSWFMITQDSKCFHKKNHLLGNIQKRVAWFLVALINNL